MLAAKNRLLRQNRHKLFVFAMVIWGIPLQAQQDSYLIQGRSIPALRKKEILPALSVLPFRLALPTIGWQQETTRQRPHIPLVYAYEDLGFFCKVEVQLEKRTRIPIKIRLGEVQYVERLEGKYNYP